MDPAETGVALSGAYMYALIDLYILTRMYMFHGRCARAAWRLAVVRASLNQSQPVPCFFKVDERPVEVHPDKHAGSTMG